MVGGDPDCVDSFVIPWFVVGKRRHILKPVAQRLHKIPFLSWQKNCCDGQLNKNLWELCGKSEKRRKTSSEREEENYFLVQQPTLR